MAFKAYINLEEIIMSIRLETSMRNGIENFQDTEISSFDLNWAKSLKGQFPNIIPRTNPNPRYNCHGLTFASRRTKIINPAEVQKIIADDLYTEVPLDKVKPGDVVIYYSDRGDANHSGFVVSGISSKEGEHLFVPMICSKWGSGGEFIHALTDCPKIYGPVIRYFRSSPW
jgi:hypothetical protein